jgi:hypothetical protein
VMASRSLETSESAGTPIRTSPFDSYLLFNSLSRGTSPAQTLHHDAQ